ncbi:MAG: hypothetical protein RL235_309 [Chlamydiota bacterium]
MANTINILSPSSPLLSLRTGDSFRKGHIVRLNVMTRIFFGIAEWFRGGRAKNDAKAFDAFYPEARRQITDLHERLRTGEVSELAFSQVTTALKVAAKIGNSSWGKHCATRANANYLAFHQEVEALRRTAVARLEQLECADVKTKHIMTRWVRSNERQRAFAAYLDLKEPPYVAEELPVGAVLVLDPHWYLAANKLSGAKTIAKTTLIYLKMLVCWLFTGIRFTHAELVLSNRQTFDLEKKPGTWIQGRMRLRAMEAGKIQYGTVLVPNQEKILAAHQEAFGEGAYPTFDALWAAIEKRAREGVPHMKAGLRDVLKIGRHRATRAADYDPRTSWDPHNKRLGCSSSIAALFGSFGIDLGKEFGRRADNMSPADLSRSEYFMPLFDPHRLLNR